jgi:DNA-binding LacI/PurR family transcriptional regulator
MVLSGGQSNTRVSEATRLRILKAADELKYHPNELARSLRRRKSHMIGFYMGGFIDMRNLFLADMVSGLQEACEKNRRDFVIHGTFRGDSVDDIYAELVNGKVDGLVILAGRHGDLVKRLAVSHLPIMPIVDPVPGVPSVTVDDIGGSRMLAGHLAKQGHRRLLYGLCPYNLSSANRRYEAFRQAAEEYGMSIAARCGRGDLYVISEAENAFVSWPKPHRPTALVCWNDLFGYQAVQYFREQGFSVPGDVAVTGFDGLTTNIPQAFQLTTIRAPWHNVARTAVDLLVNRPDKPLTEDVVLPVEFVLGETC